MWLSIFISIIFHDIFLLQDRINKTFLRQISLSSNRIESQLNLSI